ncbi:MAG: hypothetical protein G3M70_05975 [Candidatus Nitronauta litoralis]|uniref:Uncharacterized protein n=1 Tax=Candidatus Nitronauta litoralis TaxID=2705533 RepID=A0A7T0BUX7_9BACT|nr:MAG: hypothetical protein G3M70_05975 [Candidatus Nitronauta litoralis]
MIGWIIRRLLLGVESRLKEIKQESLSRFEKIDRVLERIEAERVTDQRKLYEQFVTKEWYLLTTGKTESSLGGIFQQLQALNKKLQHQKPHYSKTG